jgi:N-acetylglutamate synthase
VSAEITIRAMEAADYERIITLWRSSAGVGLSRADSQEAITRYLARNPGLSLVAFVEGEAGSELVGAVLCGHDGRRGFLHHLAVRPDFRRQGVGRALVERCLQGLAAEGIDKCHLFVFRENGEGRNFWLRCGWHERGELEILSTDIPGVER